ncbi:plasmid stability protein [Mycoplana sp. BE70]|uniref:FitA-like ribbon-helix-helix domain-containing protein n=1 Tax=Mycoplana sp. BE70 TaxID=2817775 RepID=UPI00285A6D2D|nr:plasmid stabilization protein [Mycoplana sp. BE70]MDR6756000.1 plasmid stability protein [Mycoplana sp. BE70]
MAAVTIRNLPEETHRALKLRAARNGRSTEAEILESEVNPEARMKIGTALKAFGEKYGDIDLDRIERHPPIEPADFE